MTQWVEAFRAGAGARASAAADFADLRAVAREARRRVDADLVTVTLAGDEPGEATIVVQETGPVLSGAEDALGTQSDPLGLAEAVRAEGVPVVWDRVGDAAAASPGLERLLGGGGTEAWLARALSDAGATAVPLEPGVTGGGGALIAVHLDGHDPPHGLIDTLAELAPLARLAARAERLDARLGRARSVSAALAACAGAVLIEWDRSGRVIDWHGPVEAVLGIDPVSIAGRRTGLAASALAARLDDVAEKRLRGPLRDAAPEHLATKDGREVRHERREVGVGGTAVVDVFMDVTRERRAQSESARLAAEKAELHGREVRRVGEEVALSRAAHAMASEMTRAEIHERLLAEARRLVPCDKAAVLELDARGDLLPVATAGFSAHSVRRMIFRAGEGLAGTVVSEGRAFTCDDVEGDPRISRRIVGPERIRSFLHVPILLGERVYGLVSVNSERPGAFGDRDARVLGELARHAATALGNAREYERERHVAETLQRSLLADDLPRVPGLELATLYRPSEGALVGGDFYAVWPVGRRVAVLLGDVSGRGVEAAGLTAMVRYMAEALARSMSDSGEVLTELNRLLWGRMPDGALVTVLLVVIDAEGSTLQWTSAGHPPALLVDTARRVTALDDPDPPCGAFPTTRYATHVESFTPGDLLFAYTDGLSEARRSGTQFDEDGIRRALLESHSRPPGEIARQVYANARAWAGGRIDDDVAIAVISRIPG